MSDLQPACADAPDPEIFFPEGRKDKVAIATYKATSYCARCPVVESCLEMALKSRGAQVGIFGGKTAEEREKIIRTRRRRARAV